MADLLTKLVQRTLGLAPTVAPSIVPLFAPDASLSGATAPVVAAPPDAPSAIVAASEAEPAPRPEAPSAEDGAPVAATSAVASMLTAPTAEAGVSRHAGDRQSAAPATSQPPVIEISTGRVADAFGSTTAPQLRPTASREAGKAEGHRSDDALLLPPHEPGPPRAVPRAPAAPVAGPPPQPPGRPSSAPLAEAAIPWEDSPDTALLMPLNPPVAATGAVASILTTPTAEAGPSRRGEPVAAASGPPVIEITIGRVEVRAVQPPAPARSRPAAPPAPQVSLEEYLRRQNGGKR